MTTTIAITIAAAAALALAGLGVFAGFRWGRRRTRLAMKHLRLAHQFLDAGIRELEREAEAAANRPGPSISAPAASKFTN